MQLNNDKFELISYKLFNPNNNLKLLKELPFQSDLQTYVAVNLEIFPSTYVRDLGVYVDNLLSWSEHYHVIYNKCKRLCAWIFSSFSTRHAEVMMTLFHTLVKPILQYCCEVWSPHLKKDIVLLEQIQRSFTSRITGLQDLNYWQRLDKLGISSLQRLRERMILLHVFKIKNKFYPNTISLEFKLHERSNSIKAVLKPLPKVKGALLKKYEASFVINCCKLWNSLPYNLTHISSLNLFKVHLDKFLITVPDEPPIPGYPFVNSNSVSEQCLRLKFK